MPHIAELLGRSGVAAEHHGAPLVVRIEDVAALSDQHGLMTSVWQFMPLQPGQTIQQLVAQLSPADLPGPFPPWVLPSTLKFLSGMALRALQLKSLEEALRPEGHAWRSLPTVKQHWQVGLVSWPPRSMWACGTGTVWRPYHQGTSAYHEDLQSVVLCCCASMPYMHHHGLQNLCTHISQSNALPAGPPSLSQKTVLLSSVGQSSQLIEHHLIALL